jgi:hypothetical protein
MTALTHYRAQISASNEYAWLELLESRINDAIKELAAGYPKHDTPDIINIAIGHGEMMAGYIWQHMKRLDDGENA